MERTTITNAPPHCPSAQANWEGSTAFGIVTGTADEPQVAYLAEPQPVTDELLALSGPVHPTEIFRFAAPCAGSACQHFDGAKCRLVGRIVEGLPAVSEHLPPCKIRSTCRWWQQEGKAACLRCPQIVTENHAPSEQLARATDPSIYGGNLEVVI